MKPKISMLFLLEFKSEIQIMALPLVSKFDLYRKEFQKKRELLEILHEISNTISKFKMNDKIKIDKIKQIIETKLRGVIG